MRTESYWLHSHERALHILRDFQGSHPASFRQSFPVLTIYDNKREGTTHGAFLFIFGKFHTCLQCPLITVNSPIAPLIHLPPDFMSSLFIKPTESCQHGSYTHVWRVIHKSMGSLLGATFPKKRDSPSHNSYQLSNAPQLGVGPGHPLLSHTGIFNWLDLVQDLCR